MSACHNRLDRFSRNDAGAVSLVQGDGRAEKYRHLLYDWLGVDKAELAVMTELLLRGAQTVGELRGRAARMEPIADLGALLPIVDRLRQKNLIIYLTPPGRGAVVTHNLYQPQELAKVKAEHAGGYAETGGTGVSPVGSEGSATYPARTGDTPVPPIAPSRPSPPLAQPAAREEDKVSDLKSDLAALRRELAELHERTDEAIDGLRRELADLKGQLGG